MITSKDYKPSKYVAKWFDEESGKWYPVDWSDFHDITDKQVEKVRRSLNKSLREGGINQHVRKAMKCKVWFTKCLIVNRRTRKLVYRSKK